MKTFSGLVRSSWTWEQNIACSHLKTKIKCMDIHCWFWI